MEKRLNVAKAFFSERAVDVAFKTRVLELMERHGDDMAQFLTDMPPCQCDECLLDGSDPPSPTGPGPQAGVLGRRPPLKRVCKPFENIQITNFITCRVNQVASSSI